MARLLDLLQGATLYDVIPPVEALPVAQPVLVSGVPELVMPGMMNHGTGPLAAFNYAGNWYVAPKVNGKVPTDPAHWSLVSDGQGMLGGHTKWFYHSDVPGGGRISNAQILHDISNGLSTKSIGGVLPEIKDALNPSQMQAIILAKEVSGAGLRANGTEPLNQFLREHGPEIFEVTNHDRHSFTINMSEYNLRSSAEQPQRLALHEASGIPFARDISLKKGELGSHVFYSILPEFPAGHTAVGEQAGTMLAPLIEPPSQKVRRVQVHLDEILQADGTRTYSPRAAESIITLSDAFKEMGEGARIAPAPHGIVSYFEGRHQSGLDHYAATRVSEELWAGDYVHKSMGKHEGVLHHQMGEQLKARELKSNLFYRITRPEDYISIPADHPYNAVAGGSAPATTNLSALAGKEAKLFEPNRADYFFTHEHPQYTAHIHGSASMAEYKGPTHELIFLKGGASGEPHAVEKLAFDTQEELAIALRKRGITHDTDLMHIGENEFADLSHRRNLKGAIDLHALEKEAEHALHFDFFKYVSIGDYPKLTNPIRMDEAGKLVGDLEAIRANGIYKLGDDTFVHFNKNVLGSENSMSLDVYKKLPDGKIALKKQGLYSVKRDLIELLHGHKTGLTDASEEEILGIIDHLQAIKNGASTETAHASLALMQLVQRDKSPLSKDFIAECHVHAEEMHRLYSPRSVKPIVELLTEKPVEPPSIASSTTKAAESEVSALAKEAKGKSGKALWIAGGAVVALGALTYGVKKYSDYKKRKKAESWQEQVKTDVPINGKDKDEAQGIAR